ncbi:MAG: hypothetical protein KBB95_20500 [Deltaproteobacteria bacterium]|nr:hypothetical protein [Deltaproteobacteria bacterium]
MNKDSVTVGDLARERRRHTLIERPEAQAQFLRCLDSDASGPCVLFLSAPGGTGKTMSLRLFETLARERGVATTWVDARDVPADARAAELRFAEALADLADARRGVVFVDTFEAHQSLERIYRDRILPTAPKTVRVVLASRHSPDLRFRSDPAWDRLLLVYRLPLLSPTEAEALLRAREVPEAERPELIQLARGHALTLACLATESPEARRRYRAGPHVLAELSDPMDADERRAVFVLCLVGWIDERDLTHAAGTAGFLPRLERHGFVERVGRRWRIHDLYRAGFLARFVVELGDDLVALVRRAAWVILGRYRDEPDYERRRQYVNEVSHILRTLPPGEALFEFVEQPVYYRDAMRPADVPAIVAAIRRFEGHTSATLAAEHLARFPELCEVQRSVEGEPLGVMVWMDASLLRDMDVVRDPAARRLRALAQPGRGPRMLRWWLSLETYQEPTPAFFQLTLDAAAAGLARTDLLLHAHAVRVLTPASGSIWHDLGLLDRFTELEFDVEGHAYTVLGYDFRRETPLERMFRNIDCMAALATPPGAAQPASAPPPARSSLAPAAPLSDLEGAVSEALRWYRHDDRLSRVRLASAMPEETPLARAARVRTLLETAHARMRPTGRYPEPATLITRAYFDRTEKQLAIASEFGVPHGTFRRKLREAVELLSACVLSVWAEVDEARTG